MNLIIASNNQGKVLEIKEMTKELGFSVLSLKDAGILIDIEETGITFEENATLKAKAIFDAITAGADGIDPEITRNNSIVIADDSGLCVDALNGAPGVYSARYAGENATDAERYEKLLTEMINIPADNRTARFICVICLIYPNGEAVIVSGSCEGVIANMPVGERGFGYDPVFYMPQFEMTIAQMPPELKNSISHRGKAITLMLDELKKGKEMSKTQL